jgi:hypothetical protein
MVAGRVTDQELKRLRTLLEQTTETDPHRALGAIVEAMQRLRVLRDRIIREELSGGRVL